MARPTTRKSKSGFFVSFEGGEGSGKTTQIKHLVAWLEAKGLKVTVTKEPGGTTFGKTIRSLILDPNHGHLAPRAELLLYQADRAQHVTELVVPALNRGEVVITDRFMDSSTVYQGICRGLGKAWVQKLNDFATGGLVPDLVLLLDLSEQVGMARIRARTTAMDRLDLEKAGFHRKVRKGFLELAKSHPRRFEIINAARSESEVAAEIQRVVERRLKRRPL